MKTIINSEYKIGSTIFASLFVIFFFITFYFGLKELYQKKLLIEIYYFKAVCFGILIFVIEIILFQNIINKFRTYIFDDTEGIGIKSGFLQNKIKIKFDEITYIFFNETNSTVNLNLINNQYFRLGKILINKINIDERLENLVKLLLKNNPNIIIKKIWPFYLPTKKLRNLFFHIQKISCSVSIRLLIFFKTISLLIAITTTFYGAYYILKVQTFNIVFACTLIIMAIISWLVLIWASEFSSLHDYEYWIKNFLSKEQLKNNFFLI